MVGSLAFTASVLLCAVTASGATDLSNDPELLQVAVQQMATQVNLLQAQLTALTNRVQHLQNQVRRSLQFTAYIEEANVPETENGVIIFNHIVSGNGDNSYNKVTGVFTAPYDGDYIFLVSVDVTANYTELAIRKNGEAVVFGENDGDHHITTWATLSLVEGDTVTVTHAGEVEGKIDGGHESVMSGFLL